MPDSWQAGWPDDVFPPACTVEGNVCSGVCGMDIVEALKALFIGLVEGLTEWLPISSTGHMILVDEFVQLDVSDEFLELFLVVIQLGAIMAVVILYFDKLNPFSRRKTRVQRSSTWRLWGMVVVGCVPAAVVGVLFDDWVNAHFYNAYVVASMLIVYGIVFIVIETRNGRRLVQAVHDSYAPGAEPFATRADGSPDPDALFSIRSVDDIDAKTALKIGLFQCLAIIPGTSRSGATIIGGMLMGCSRTAAAEFTFFLAIPVMLGWGLLKAVKYVLELGSLAMTATELGVLVIGVLTAFLVSVASIKFLMGYVKGNDFRPFGIYRICIGLVVLAYFGMRALVG